VLWLPPASVPLSAGSPKWSPVRAKGFQTAALFFKLIPGHDTRLIIPGKYTSKMVLQILNA
jgi:hypothetical protein